MQINLSWDLFIIVFFLIILSYSFIIGKISTIKLVISSYISLLAADAMGNMINTLMLKSNPIIDVFINPDASVFTVVKISFFIICMVVFAVKGAFYIKIDREDPVIEFLLTFFFGALSAGIIISGVLVFASGSSFILGGVPISESNIAEMYNSSYLVKIMVMNYNIWFALPVVSFLVMSIRSNLANDSESE